MQVQDLIRLLNEYDPDTEIYLSSDGEGNSFSPLGASSVGSITSEENEETHITDFSDMSEREYYHSQLGWEYEEMDELPVVLVLWP